MNTTNDISTLIAVILSVISFLYIIIIEFFLPGKIIANFSQYLIPRIPTGNKKNVVNIAIEMDFLSSHRSEWANELVKINSQLPTLANTNKVEFHSQLTQILSKKNIVPYFRNDIIIDIAKQTGFGTNFGVPLSIANIGYKPIFISRISLEIITQKKEKYWFDSLVSFDTLKLFKRENNVRDVDRWDKVFMGKWIAAKQTIEICPNFSIRIEGDNIIWAKNNLTIGKHKGIVHLYNDKGKSVYKTKTFEIDYSEKQILESFQGNDIAINLTPYK